MGFNKNKVCLTVAMIFAFVVVQAQIDSAAMSKYAGELDAVFGAEEVAIEYRRICKTWDWDFINKPNPEQCYEGGYSHYYANGKYKVDLGWVKMISDGVLEVICDELETTMIVDSIDRIDRLLWETSELPRHAYDSLLDLEDLADTVVSFQETPTESDAWLAYEEITASGAACTYIFQASNHKLIAWVENEVREEGESEASANSGTLYVLKSVKTKLKDPDFKINMPPEEVRQYEGYWVEDRRYMNFH